MKIAFIYKNNILLVGSKYKYKAMLENFADVNVIWDDHETLVDSRIMEYKPDLIAVMGDGNKQYKYAIKHGIPYILFQMDVKSMRENPGQEMLESEMSMVLNAYKIVCTSENHAEYLLKRYGVDSLVIYLRPLLRDLDFEPLPKLPGKHLVYAGGITTWKLRSEGFGYRAYHAIFKHFMKSGWTVHVYPGYPLSENRRKDYNKLKVVLHDIVPEGRMLYKELSQYTAGFQGYNPVGTKKKVLQYALSCRPNKLWLYAAAGIPTISYSGGKGVKIMTEGGWGVKIGSIKQLSNLILPEVTDEMRYSNVIDDYVDLLKGYILNGRDN